MNDENQSGSIQKKYEFAKKFSVLITTPIYTILHTMLGYRFPIPWVLCVNSAGLVLFPIFFPALARPIPYLMPLFGIVTLICGLAQRHRRWRELLAGQAWHSFSNGIAHIAYIEKFTWWPDFWRKENRLVRWVEPLLLAAVGAIVTAFMSRAFGLYLVATSAFMWLFQQAVFEASIAQLLDMLDGMIFSEAQGRSIAFFNTKNPTVPPPSVKELEGVSTGLSHDLLKTLELKRAKKINASDNLASTRA